MKLYHASNVKVEKPDIVYSRDFLDFGKGFYLTTLEEQAIKYAERFVRRRQEAWLNAYELDLELDSTDVNILQFDAYDKAWLQFVSNCRAGLDKTDYDIVFGGIANDKVIRTLDRYFIGELSEEQALGYLKYERPNNQLCIRKQSLLEERLRHINSKKL